MRPETFADLYGGTRHRALTGYAEQARQAAANLRSRKGRFPSDALSMEAEAAGLDRYADACDLAAADQSLPTPAYEPPDRSV